MIINTQSRDVDIIGDVKEYKTSIDPKNLEFITTLLSSNLYSNPEQSFIREIVSNAWDSHVEANTTDIPIIIRFKKEEELWEISIRDFGTGISPKRFKEIYCNIGSSTKRESNEFIGGFGLGRYSALACTNTVYITSYYNGVSTLYMIIKSGNVITTNLISERTTDEKNGVEVTIKGIQNVYSYKRALNDIVFFPNIYIEGIDNDVNSIKIKKFTNFAVASNKVNKKLLLENVLYPYDVDILSEESRNFLNKIYNTGIVIKFEVGELSITPNREDIIYTSDTINKVNYRIKSAQLELESLVARALPKNYNNLLEFYNVTSNFIQYNLINDSYRIDSIRSYNFTDYNTNVDIKAITYKGKSITEEEVASIRVFFNMLLPNIKGYLYKDTYKPLGNIAPSSKRDLCMQNSNIVCLAHCNKITRTLKEYLLLNYPTSVVITYFTKEEFMDYIKPAFVDVNSNNIDFIKESMYDYIMTTATFIDVKSDLDFLDYKKEHKSEKGVRSQIPSEIILYIQYQYSKTMLRFNTVESCIKYMKNQKRGIILLNLKENHVLWYAIAQAKRLLVCKAKPETVNLLKGKHLTCIVDKEYYINKDPFLTYIHTVINCCTHKLPPLYRIKPLINIIPEELANEAKDIIENYYTYIDTSYGAFAKDVDIPIDAHVADTCNKLLNYYGLYKGVYDEIGITDIKLSPFYKSLIVAVILKSKAFRVNFDAYKRFKNDKLISLLCKS